MIEGANGQTNYIDLDAGTIASNFTYTWPSSYPATTGDMLTGTTGGVLSWVTPLSGSGSANRIAYWDGTKSLTSSSKLLYDGTDLKLNCQTRIIRLQFDKRIPGHLRRYGRHQHRAGRSRIIYRCIRRYRGRLPGERF